MFRFINLDISSLTDKWYGESQKLAGAVFTLARKIQPCIIFIDEIDSLLRVRTQQDHEATAMIKAQFMQLWDGELIECSCFIPSPKSTRVLRITVQSPSSSMIKSLYPSHDQCLSRMETDIVNPTHHILLYQSWDQNVTVFLLFGNNF